MHRVYSTAKLHALERSPPTVDSQSPTLTPASRTTSNNNNNALPSTTPTSPDSAPLEKQLDGANDAKSGDNNAPEGGIAPAPPPAPPPDSAKEEGVEHPAIEPENKPTLFSRAKAGSVRFVKHTKDAITHSWINVLLVFVPIGIAVNWAPISHDTKPTIIFAMNAVAIVPLAGLLSHATESVASRMGDTWASLLNVTFGNAVELIIFIIALAKDQIRIVQASILGSILANLLLILGMAFLLGGLRFREQIYNSTVTQMSACLLSLSVVSLLLPTAFHASFSSSIQADKKTIKISRGTSVILLIVYVLYLLFQLKSHAYMYESTPQQIIDEESHPGVLADAFNSTDSSDESTSSSSSDSDASSGSENTARNRWKKKFRHKMRRKSSMSSNGSASVPSAMSLASTSELPSVFESNTPPSGQIDKIERRRTDVPSGTVLRGDEAEPDVEPKSNAPRVRDFENKQNDNSASPSGSAEGKGRKKRFKHRYSKSREEKRKKTKKPRDENERQDIRAAQAPTVQRVDFATEVETVPVEPANSKRPSVIRQISKPGFRPPLGSVFNNTVFSSPPPDQRGLIGSTRVPGTVLRRTSSLPDRLSNQASAYRAQAISKHATEPILWPVGAPLNETANANAEDDEKPLMSRTAAVMLLLISTGLVAFCAELLVDAIPEMISDTSVSEAFIGLIILPIVGNAAEHVTAVTVAAKNKMDLAIGVAVGSSIQIALFITPVVVLIGWIMEKDMSLYFNLFETISLFATVFVVNFLVLDGRSNYLEGSLLIAAYIIIAVAAFFYPNQGEASAVGGGSVGR